MISKKVGIVESIKSSDDNLEDIRVNVNGQIHLTRALSSLPAHSTRLGGSVAASGSECVLFVRSYSFDRIFTRPTIILDMPLTLSASSRNQDTPNIVDISNLTYSIQF